jgi:hypothetical protein
LATCIERGLKLVVVEQESIRRHVKEIASVEATLDSANGRCSQRKRAFQRILLRLDTSSGRVPAHMAKVMKSFRSGLFSGGDAADQFRDNLDLERWFRIPKGHERRIHGRSHAGIRIVQEGPTLALALDAHQAHPEPFTADDLFLYRTARAPECQLEAMCRRTIMRKARSKKRRPQLLAELEHRYFASL